MHGLYGLLALHLARQHGQTLLNLYLQVPAVLCSFFTLFSVSKNVTLFETCLSLTYLHPISVVPCGPLLALNSSTSNWLGTNTDVDLGKPQHRC